VAGSDNKREIGRKTIRQRRYNGQVGIDPTDAQHDPHREHGKEEEGHGCSEQVLHAADALHDELCRIAHINQIGRHAAKHGAGPLGVFARLGAHLLDLLRHAVVLHGVVLLQSLAAKLRGKIECRGDKEDRQRSQQGQHSLGKVFYLVHGLCLLLIRAVY